VGTLLQSEDALSVLAADWRPWPKIKEGTEESQSFYTVHDRNKEVHTFTQSLTLTLYLNPVLTLTKVLSLSYQTGRSSKATRL
jgi:hypothetical protein